MAYERVAKAILNAPWRNEEGGVEEEERNKKRKGKGKPKAEGKPKGGERSDGGDSPRDPPGAPEAPGPGRSRRAVPEDLRQRPERETRQGLQGSRLHVASWRSSAKEESRPSLSWYIFR